MRLSDERSFGTFLIDGITVFIVVLWLWLLVMTAMDLLRRRDISGFGKFLWAALLVGLPYVGIFAYILREGSGMAERKRMQAEELREDLRQFVGFGPAGELLKLNELRAHNIISRDEYLMLRSRLVG